MHGAPSTLRSGTADQCRGVGLNGSGHVPPPRAEGVRHPVIVLSTVQERQVQELPCHQHCTRATSLLPPAWSIPVTCQRG